MSESLFREEAVEHHLRDRSRGDLVHSSTRWIVWTYRAVLLLFVAGIVAGMLVRVPVYAPADPASPGAPRVRIGTEPAIVAFVPGLDRLFGGSDD